MNETEILETFRGLDEKRGPLMKRSRDILAKAEAENRDITASEEAQIDSLLSSLDAINGCKQGMANEYKGIRSVADLADYITALQPRRGAPIALDADGSGGGGDASRWQSLDGREIRVANPTERFADVVNARGGENLSIGKVVRGVATGDWRGAESEHRAMSEGTGSAGGFTVPTPLSASVIDLARNKSRIIQAGAITVPMESQTLSVARLTDDPAAAWKAENAAMSSSDMVFDKVTFTARTLVASVKMSVELFEDAPNIDAVVNDAIASALALELDRVALYGSGTAPEPQGILGATDVQTISMGTNGAALTDYTKFNEASRKVAEANGTATAAIMNPRELYALDALTDTTGQPLNPPQSFGRLAKFDTNQIPVNQTQGTASDASFAVIGDFSKVMVGVRTNLTLEVSRMAADSASSAFENVQVWVRAYLRADVQLAKPDHMVTISGIIPA